MTRLRFKLPLYHAIYYLAMESEMDYTAKDQAESVVLANKEKA